MFEYWLETELTNFPPVERIRGQVFSQDSGANKIGVRVTKNGLPVTLTGSVKAWVIKPDGSTIEIDGSKSNNTAWVVLSSSAYSVVGNIKVAIRLINDSQVTTLGVVEAHVYQSTTI